MLKRLRYTKIWFYFRYKKALLSLKLKKIIDFNADFYIIEFKLLTFSLSNIKTIFQNSFKRRFLMRRLKFNLNKLRFLLKIQS